MSTFSILTESVPVADIFVRHRAPKLSRNGFESLTGVPPTLLIGSSIEKSAVRRSFLSAAAKGFEPSRSRTKIWL